MRKPYRALLMIPAFLLNLAGFGMCLLVSLILWSLVGTSEGDGPWSWVPSLLFAVPFGLNLFLFIWCNTTRWRVSLLLAWIGNLGLAVTLAALLADEVRDLLAGMPWRVGRARPVPLWFALAPVLSLLVLHLAPPGSQNVEDRCACGYDLTGNTSGVCPECGATMGPAHALPDEACNE